MLAVKSFSVSSSFACRAPERVPLTSILPADVMRSLSVELPPEVVVSILISPSSLLLVSAPARNTILATSFPFHLPLNSAKCCPAPVLLLSPTK